MITRQNVEKKKMRLVLNFLIKAAAQMGKVILSYAKEIGQKSLKNKMTTAIKGFYF